MSYKKNNFELRNVCGDYVLIAQGIEHLDFGKMIALNETAAFLWERLGEVPFTAETLVELLMDEYEDVDRVTAQQDVESLLEQWVEHEVIAVV